MAALAFYESVAVQPTLGHATGVADFEIDRVKFLMTIDKKPHTLIILDNTKQTVIINRKP